ncbi:16S rRNA (guanine(1207)-N(2))-methyltransferase RsmC [Aggregatibacter actinomycetemcomitans]|uniref:16S rRNA (guanine(1207)-N(2))-methyltransferase RsmC n=1 Tax=Aggregatibacter actinomycetemcomitans TaxID=714 RepID=UPI00197C38D0|nr:16S rRNA (guanine(1207)-N(2))-methyltransferase RsmC [Aggregatibacter actinomycetemcomitans]
MICAESEVLERHLDFLNGKSLLLTGAVSDDFLADLRRQGFNAHAWSWYFDYANRQNQKQQSAVDFSLEFHGSADVILFYWTKNKQECHFQLMQLLSQCTVGQEVLLVGENRSGVRSAEKMLADYGDIHKIDSARRCSLYYFQLKNPPHFELTTFWKSYQLPQLTDLTVYALPGVFSAAELDGGAALLLDTLQKVAGDVLDVGCGAGVIGSYIQQHNPNTRLIMTDIHATALASAKRTLHENRLHGTVLASDVFSHIDGKFDLIISNPPFHDGIDTAYTAVSELIKQAKWHLKSGGELRIVANAFLPYADWLDQHFGSHDVLVKNNKFKVYSVRR